MSSNNVPIRRIDSEAHVSPTGADAIQLGSKQSIDLGGMTEMQKQALRETHARKEIERDDRTQRLAADVQVLGKSLEILSENVIEASDKGVSVTVTNTRDDHLGRTEVRIGNTEADKSGKFTRSQTGHDDRKFWLILAAVAGFVVIIVAMVVK